MNDSTESSEWLILTHQLPPSPDYLRVKIRRRLDQVGAVALKASVYVLPNGDDALEDFQWIRGEVEREGGEATVCEATFVDGVTNERLAGRFRSLRETEYESIADSIVELRSAVPVGAGGTRSEAGLRRRIAGLRRRLEAAAAAPQFGARGKQDVERGLEELEAAMRAEDAGVRGGSERPVGRTWVTREGVKVDRMASAWLIRRFIDANARFRFVPARGYEPQPDEIRFDMFEGEYTHEGDACTFEVLMTKFAAGDAALEAIAEIVHDIDCKDERYGRLEAAGVASLIDGIVRRHPGDEARLSRGDAMWDDLYRHFRTGSGESGKA